MRNSSLPEYSTTIALIILVLFALIFIFGFSRSARAGNTFDNDLTLLKRHIEPIVLSSGGQRLVVSAELQGRILIASSEGFKNRSIGWINRNYLSTTNNELPASKIDIQKVGGGADRLWFGPDGGKFSVFFEPGAQTLTENIRVPPNLAQQPFVVAHQSDADVLLENAFSFHNHLGFEFDVHVARTVSLFDENRMQDELAIEIPDGLAWVAYGSKSSVTNVSDVAWRTETGLFSIWSLSTFAPKATIAIPLKKTLTNVTNYFIPASDRQTHVTDKVVFYNADANFMNKIGIPPQHTLPFIGSYNQDLNQLTIIKFQISDLGAGYVNAVWDPQAAPLNGEIINIFNDGVQENGKPFGPFYEMETSSAALALKPKQSHSHYHYTFHFSGTEDQLSVISEKLLHASLQELKDAF